MIKYVAETSNNYMKTKYMTSEDQAVLAKIFRLALMQTEKVFDEGFIKLVPDYTEELIKIREKIYEYLEGDDPNSYLLSHIKRDLNNEREI